MTLNRKLETNQFDIEKTFLVVWQTDTELQTQVKIRVEKFRALLPVASELPSNQSVQAILVAQNTFLIMVKTVLENAYPDFSSEEWLELEEEFHQDMRRGDRASATVQVFRQLADTVFSLVESNEVKRDGETGELWRMVKLCYQKQTSVS